MANHRRTEFAHKVIAITENFFEKGESSTADRKKQGHNDVDVPNAPLRRTYQRVLLPVRADS